MARPPSSRLAGVVATGLANLYLLVGSVFFAVLSLAVAWIPPRGHWVFHTARGWARGILWTSGVRLRVSFEEPLEAALPVVFMANHQSLLDIPALLTSFPGQTRMLAKRSLFKIPVFGWAMRAGGFIAIDRDNRSRAGDSFSSAVAKLRGGVSALVFPEGTRSRDGRLGPFQRGGFLLAIKSGLPIVPVGLVRSGEHQARGSRRVRPGRLTVVYGRPIDTASFGLRRRAELADEVRRRIAALADCELG